MGAPYPDIVNERSFRKWHDDLSMKAGASFLGDIDPTTGDAVTYTPADSYQVIGPDLQLGAASGQDIGEGTSHLASIMGNVLGASLTKTGTYLGGLIGAYSITGTKATHLQAGAVLGKISDLVTEADGAFVAILDGDSGVTTATAAFAARGNNSTPGSGFDYGLDLHSPAHDGFNALAILKADLRLSNQVCMLNGAGVPTDGGSGTGANFAAKGSIYVDTTNGKLYVNGGSLESPTWKLVTSAA